MPYEVLEIGHGWTGTDQTVRKIRSMVRASLMRPEVVREARDIVRYLPERDRDAEIRAVSRYVRNRIRYTNEAIETLSSPWDMVREIHRYGKAVGDCDEHVTLWAALLRALGHRVRIRVISQRPNRVASHVWGEVLSPTRGWVSDDTIAKRKPLGWRVTRHVTAERVYPEDGGRVMDPLWNGRAGTFMRERRGMMFADEPEEMGVVVALIGAAATLAATGAQIAMQKKAEKKAKKAEKKARRQAAEEMKRAEEEEARAMEALRARRVSAEAPAGGFAWPGIGTLALIGAGIVAVALLGGRR